MIKAVLFDLDGTLTDSSPGITKCVQYALERYGITETDLAKLHKFIGPPLSESFMKYYDFSEEKALEAVEAYRERFRTKGIYENDLYPNTKECLLKLKEQGYRIALASSKPEEFCNTILEYHQIRQYFDEVCGATMDGRIGKKEEVLGELLGRWSEISCEEMILIGDTIFDVEGAKQVGMDCIGVTFGFGTKEEMEEAGAIAFCDSMADLPEIIRHFNDR